MRLADVVLHSGSGRSEVELFSTGPMGDAMRAFDWPSTPLGPVAAWPRSLKTVVRLMLDSRYAMWLAWGPELTFFCNDAYRPTLGVKQDFIGAPASTVWAEIWPDIGPRIAHVLSKGEATWDEALLLFLERRGFKEETYHSFSYSPVRGDGGAVEGMLCVVTEDTERILGERRVAALGALSSAALATHNVSDACRLSAESLGRDMHDAPLVLVYLLDDDARFARRVAQAGLASVALPAGQRLDEAAGAWPFDAVLRSGQPQRVNDVPARIGAHPARPWPEPVQQACVLPLARAGRGERFAGFLVVGLSPRLPLDSGYERFLALAAAQVANAIADARVFEDEQRRVDELAALDRAKTAFFTNVSHEFRTPLALLLGPLEDLRDQAATPSQHELADIAWRNAQRLLKLVNTLLDFARVEGGRANARFVPTDLATLTAELASSFRSACERAGLSLTVDCAPLPQPVFVDRDMWEKVVLNLLSNAFKFTFEGGIVVRLRSTPDGTGVELQVGDSGTGIAAGDLPKLFQRFQRIEGARGRSFEGSGIGLSLVAELLKLHGATIHAASEPGRGSTFTVRLRWGCAHLPPQQVATAMHSDQHAGQHAAYVGEALRWLHDGGNADDTGPLPRDHAPGGPAVLPGAQAPRVLIADDNADLRGYLRRLLGVHYRVTEATDGASALESALGDPPDLVLSDVMMPRLDGFGLVERLRADARTRALPVILLSARAGEEARVEGLAGGADDYLVKPFSARELLARVGAHLAAARVRRDAMTSIAAVVEQSLVGVTRKGLDGRLVAANARYCEIVGRDAATLPRLTPLEITHPNDRDRYATEFGRLVRGEIGSFVMEKRYLRPDGTEVWVRNHVNLLRDAAGAASGVVAIVLDIHASKRAEEARRASERLLTESQRVAHLGSWEWDAASDRTVASEGLRRIYGVSDDVPFPDFVQQRGTLYPDASWQRLNAAVQEAVRSGRGYELDVEALRNGEPIWITTRCEALHDADGRTIGLRGTVQDITARKHTELALARSEAQLRQQLAELQAIYDTAPLGMGTLDTDFRFRRINARLAEMNGLPAAEQLGRTPYEIVPALAETAEAVLRRVVESGRAERFELRGQTQAEPGVDRVWDEVWYPLLDPTGRVTGVGILADEVTEQRRTQAELRDAERRKDEFLATLSHELRNPLAPLRNGLHLLRLTIADPARHKPVLETMERQVAHMVRLVDDLMEVSRITRGKVELRRELLDLADVLRHAAETAGPKLRSARNALELRLPVEPVRVDGDAVRLTQVFSNLLDNASKYNDTGAPIVVTLGHEGSKAVVRVSDSGTGIPAEMLQRVFELFTQVDRTLGRAQGGLGIGLALVKSLVEMHGGCVEARSEGLGRGSEFIVRLPLAAPNAAAAPGRVTDDQANILAGLRVLVVDDNRDAADSLAAMLVILGGEVHTAYDGRSALAAVRAFGPSVLLLDLGMPGMSGYAVAKQLRSEPQYQALRLIALTGWGQQEDLRRTREAGFDEHLVKPVEPEQLVRLLVGRQRPM